MNNTNWIKIASVSALLAVLAGCAAEPPKEEPKPTPAPAQVTEPAPVVVEEKPAPAPAPMAVPTKPADDTYLVVRGDSLWKISGKPSIYNNPYQWPLIYKANRDKIKDADLIFPGQSLVIKRDVAQSEIDGAINHAKTRGAWSIGEVEASDEAYLKR